MTESRPSWRESSEWKSLYSKVYLNRRVSMPKTEEPRRISFMDTDTTPYTDLLMQLRSSSDHSELYDPLAAIDSSPTPLDYKARLKTILSRQSEMYPSRTESRRSGSLGRHDTMLLDMVREHNRELQDEAQDQPLDLPRDDVSLDSSEPCVHGFSHRFTERSVSRSRFSRISTRRDMDIPSILAFNPSDVPPATLPLGIPAFQKVSSPKKEEVPRWSIRRSMCPVCSQKWRDRSSVAKIKNSGLKRNGLIEIPSVIAPARLRTLATEHSYRPALVDVENEPHTRVGLRNTSAAWQLIRARRIRMPKMQLPPEATAPPAATAPLKRKDLDARVNSFLST